MDAPARVASQMPRSASSVRKPVIAQPLNTSPPIPPAKFAPPAKSPTDIANESTRSAPSKLIPDLSSYTNPFQVQENDGTTLEELAHLVRLSKYQERKRAITRKRLQRSLISTALSARLTRCGEIARRNLVDCFRTDDKKIFGPLYNAIYDVRKSCDELRRFALLEPELSSPQSPVLGSSETLDALHGSATAVSALGDVAPFLAELPASARESFLHFLTQIRTNPEYLAARLCCLSTAELNALTSFHHGLEPIESVLPYHGRSATRAHASMSGRHATQQHTTAIERLLSFQRHDPLSALIHTCFANSAGPDSAEDKRRTDIWATTLARLITDSSSNSEHIMMNVLHIWSSMRDWAGKSNMEWFLMKILEDGAFLLDRAEDQHGTRFNVSDWSAKDSIRAEEFYDKAVQDLFEIVDDEDAIGIPEGLLELGNAILNRLDSKYIESTRNWLVYKWLFSSFLLNVIIHPESHGMMAEYHITEYGRQKILKHVALRAQQLVVDMTWNKKGSVSIPPEIQGHVENILRRFSGSRSQRQVAKLLPARSITSLRETVEVRPYLVISPADLVTLVNALFPERRPMSAHSSSMRSVAPSISGMSSISQPMSMAASRAPTNGETASVLSTSVSSAVSDTTTSRETTQDDHRTDSPQRYSPAGVDRASHPRMENYEDDGYRLRFALREMSANLGLDTVQGSCHPCKERWAVLFISADGNDLSTQMSYDPDDEVDEEEHSSTSDTDEDNTDEGPELDKDYHQLRDSILKLVEDFEIPQNNQAQAARTQFSNRATGIKKYRSKNKILTTEKSTPSRNPYRQRKTSQDLDAAGEAHPAEGEASQANSEDPEPVLVTMLTAASSQSRAQSDFVSAHLYWRTLQQLNALTSSSLRKRGFAVLLNIFSRGPRDSIRRSASAIEEYDAWLVWLKQSQERHEGLIDGMMKRLKALRDKMWYVTDVRNSAPYEQSRNICAALKTMGLPRRWNTLQRNRAQLARGSAATYLFRTETQIMDLLSASEEQGGPNKLSDDQADKTSRWLQQSDVANFCGGEERIHRFCCEIDTCISKLVGESIMESPVLWSSELYVRDRKGFESSKVVRDKDQPWAQGADDAASIISDPDRRFGGPSRQAPTFRDLRNMSALNSSQQSFDSGSYRFSKASTALSDIVDGPDYFGISSPVHTIDSSSTFYSPFQSAISPSSTASRAHSPTTSVTNLSGSFTTPHHHHVPSFSSQSTGRPGTSASSTETIFQQRLSEEKARFLYDLKQTVLNLLLSDLGNLVFACGSETDSWFETWGQDCIDRRSANDKRGKRVPKTGKLRVIEKKKSFNNLRTAGEADSRSEATETSSVRGNDSSTTSDTVQGNSKAPSKETKEFPFKKAFQRLLRMFSVHPSPYGKLNALFELEQLIVASLGSSSKRSRLGWTQTAMSSPSIDSLKDSGRANPLEDVIDNIKERRSHALLQSPVLLPVGGGPPRSGGADLRSAPTSSYANTDAITEVLLNLLRDSSLRPKTLFRDLQFVAAFVNPTILDKTDKGKAFWNTGVAALRLKSEVCRTMLRLANDVQKRSIGGQDHVSESSQSSAATPIGNAYSLADAGKMWTVLAKEGNPAAQRELALFYLMDPELVERTTLPLSRPREVFKQAVMDKYDRGSAQNRSGARLYSSDRTRQGLGGVAPSNGLGAQSSGPDAAGAEGGIVWNDPALMCIAIHFFQAAEQGGDELATSFMRQNDLV